MGRAGFLITSVLAALAASSPSALAVESASRYPGPAATRSSTVPAPLQRAILRDYEAYWRAVFAASDPPRPDDSALAHYGAGQALGDARQVLVSDAAGGLVHRGSQVLGATVTSVAGNTATIRDCYRDNWLPHALQGNALGLPRGTLLENPTVHLRLVTLQFDGATWKTTTVTPAYQQQRTCGSLAAEQRVVDAYKRYERFMYEVFSRDRLNPVDPRLNQVVARANQSLEHVQQQIRDYLAQGIVGRWSSPKARSRERIDVVAFEYGRSATVRSCFVDDGSLTEAKTGRVLSPPDTIPTTRTVDLVLEGDTWKVVGGEKGPAC